MSMAKPPLIIGNNDHNKVPQWGVIARTLDGENTDIGMDLNSINTLVLSGSQGAGKSYTVGTITENFLAPINGVNHLPHPGCALVFHYSQSQKYRPEMTLMGQPNSNAREVANLVTKWGGTPTGVREVVILSPSKLVAARQEEFPNFQVEPLVFHDSEVSVEGYMNLMGDANSDSFEIEVLIDLMEDMRDNLTVDRLREAVKSHPLLEEKQRNFLELKLRRAKKFIGATDRLSRLFKPGRLIIVDLRDEFLSKAQAFRLMLIILSIFQDAKNADGSPFPKILVADEAHEYANDPYLVESFTRMVRLMRHISMTILIASQDPMSVAKPIKDLASMMIMLNMETEEWVTNLAASKLAIKHVPAENFCGLEPGNCWIWSRFATDQRFVERPQKCIVRPRASMHGGFTKSAIKV